MGQAERATCPKCGAILKLALPSDGERRRAFRCEKCDPADPLKSDKASGWIRSELRPPK